MTKRIAFLVLLLLTVPLYGQDKKPATLPELLLAELRSTYEQADWSDGKGNHSVGQLTHHLMFWNRWSRERLKGSTEKYTGTNDMTFYKFDAKTWNDVVHQLDEGMNEIEKWLETADEAKLKESAQMVTLICTHHAYHIGQIIYVRREQGSWSSDVHDGLHLDACGGYWGLGMLGGMAPGLWANRRVLAPPRENSC